MVTSNQNKADLPAELEAAFKSYSQAAGNIILQISLLAGLTDEAAIRLALSEEMVDIVALNLHALTSRTLFIVKAEKDKGANHANL